MGKAERFLQRIKETKKNAMNMLKQWTSKDRGDEVTVFLLQSLLTAPYNEALETLRDLKQPRHYIASLGGQHSFHLPIAFQTTDTNASFTTEALLDCGATGLYIDHEFARSLNLSLQKLSHLIPVYNADKTPNKSGPICHVVTLCMKIGDHVETATFAVTDTGRNKVILGYSWLRRHNPNIDWKAKKLLFNRCPSQCGIPQEWENEEEEIIQGIECVEDDWLEDMEIQEDDDDKKEDLEEGERLMMLPEGIDHFICTKATISQQIAEKEAKRLVARKEGHSVLDRYVKDFGPIFEKDEFNELPMRTKWDHAIELKEDSTPFTSKIYPLSKDEQQELDGFIEEHLRSGRIRPSKNPIASPFFFVKKKDGRLRPVQDYRRLNAMTIKNRYPLPLISEVIDKLSGAKYFTKFDVRWGYENVRIKEGNEWKAAFITNRGLFEPCVMFFGLTNSPATFQSMMNDLFRDLITRGVVIIYMDNILIFTKDIEEHRAITQEVLTILCKNNLFLKPEKCEWEKTKVEYLGIIVSEEGVEMDPAKVEAVKEWPAPKDKHELQQFLGFANYYRRFISRFANITWPLHKLTGNTPWTWTRQESTAFLTLKNAITSAPTLALPTDTDPYRVEADSSGYATGATLSQCQNGIWRPIAFLSKSLNGVERNYEIHDREMLAIMRALEEWRHHLQGAHYPIEIHTDHKNLKYFMTAKKLNQQQARWSLELSNFDFSLVHKLGRTMGKADALSRRPDYEKGENDNEDVVLIKPHHVRQMNIEIEDEGTRLLEKIRTEKGVERVVKQKLLSKEKKWAEEDGLILWQNRVYVPPNRHLRREIIHLHHDTKSSGHPGRYKTAELVLRSYWWPRIHADIRQYVNSCDICQRTKAIRAKPCGTLAPNRIPSHPWQCISVDLITELPTSQGYDAILVVVDRFTKMICLIPTYTTLSLEGVARLFRDHVWKDFGIPENIIYDRGSVFVSKFMEALNHLLGIQANPSTAYHPQTDGQTERVNQEVEQYLRVFVNYHQDDWTDWLSLAEFSHNDKVNSSTRHSPFYLNWGRHPRKGIEPRREV